MARQSSAVKVIQAKHHALTVSIQSKKMLLIQKDSTKPLHPATSSDLPLPLQTVK